MRMKKRKITPADSAQLRRRAETRLKTRQPQGIAVPSKEADARRLLHELEVHQVELEIQNEELRAARQEREAALERYTELYEFAPVGYAVLAEDGAIRELNLTGARFLGLERAKLVGRRFDSFVSEGDRAAYGTFFARVLESKGESHEVCEVTLVGPGGQFQAHLTAAILPRPARSILLAIEDVSLRRHAEEAVREAASRKDEFLAVLSHELRNPLAPIRNSLYVLDRSPPGGERARRARATIERQVVHLTRIIDDLLDVTRISRGKVNLQRERVELGDLVRRTLDDHRATFDQSGLRLEGRFDSELFWVDADATRLVQVLGNLLANAAKFTPREGSVEVFLQREGASVALWVRDTGVGIAPEDRARLFEPFAQAAQTLDRTRGGLGLGLAMVKGLVELHGGSVTVASAGRGTGTEFTVRLPLVDGPGRSAPAAPTRPTRRRRVLVIEDNRDAADSLGEALELSGQDTLVAYDCPSGIALAREFRPEIVLCDIGLPGMDGYALARAFRADEVLRRAHLVALTGYAQPEDLQRAAEAGFDLHVAKPPSLEKLEQVLAEAPRSDEPDRSSTPEVDRVH
jgi:PAS domain S-box-containing protein